MQIGKRLRKLREGKGWSQEHMARLINVSTGLIGRYERQERLPPIDNLIQLSNLFGVSIDYIVTGGSELPASDPLLSLLAQLTEDDRDDILALIQAKLRRRKRKGDIGDSSCRETS